MANLINNLGGERGFGENFLYRNDDGYTSAIDITPVFENGLNLFGTVYNNIYVNTNGNITFNGGLSRYTPDVIGSDTNQAIIAPFWADVDTRGGELSASSGSIRSVDYSLTAFQNWLSNDTSFFNMTNILSVLSQQNIEYFNLNSYSSFLSQASTLTNQSTSALNATDLYDYYRFLNEKQREIDSLNNQSVYNPQGNSTGSNLVWYDVDETSDIVTITWDDVGYYSAKTNKSNAFQLQLIDTHNGSFDIKFIYEDINWTTGAASGGVNGLGGIVARAGYSAGNGSNYYELPFSGNQAAMLNLENYQLAGQSQAGVWSLTLNSDGNFAGIGLEGVADTLVGGATSDVLDGRSGDDTIYGHEGDDTITGGEGNDTLDCGAGNDRFFSGFGNDYVDGGEGIDVVYYFYNYNDLTYDFSQGNIRISLDGVFSDSLVNMENIILQDVQAPLSVLEDLGNTSGEVVRLYNALLGRNPDDQGFNYWVGDILSSNSNGTIQDVARAFSTSTEYNVRFGAQSEEAFINQLYNNILGRDADASGYSYWIEEIASSGDRSGMIVSFSNSAEYQNTQEVVVQNYLNSATLSLDLM